MSRADVYQSVDILDRRDYVLVSEHDEVCNERLPRVRGKRSIVLEQKAGQMRGEFCGFFGITLGDLNIMAYM